jgi:hypothetical protein
MEAPIVPRWLTEEIKTRWPSLVVCWERFPDTDYIVLPIDGRAFARHVERGKVLHKYLYHERQEAFDWFVPEERETPSSRYCIRDTRHFQHPRGTRIFDCVTQDGIPVHPSQAWINALVVRCDAWDRSLKAIEAQEAAMVTEDGLVLTAAQAQAREEFREAMLEPAAHTLSKLHGNATVGAGTTILHGRVGVSTKVDRPQGVSRQEYRRLRRKAQIVRGG